MRLYVKRSDTGAFQEVTDLSELPADAVLYLQRGQAFVEYSDEAERAKIVARSWEGSPEDRQPDVSRRPPMAVPAGSAARVFDPPEYQALYRRQPELRELRNPRIDRAMADWVIGMSVGDRGLADRAARQCHDLVARTAFAEGSVTGEALAGNAAAIIPRPLSTLIVLARSRSAVIRSVATVIQAGSGRTVRVPGMGRATAAIYAEGAGAPEGAGALAEPILQKRKLGVSFQSSVEVLEDSPFSLVSLFSERAGAAIGAGEDVEFTKTSSVLVSASIAGGTAGAAVGGDPDPTPASATAVSVGHLRSLYFSLPLQYRGNAAWFVGDAMLARISALEDVGERPLLLAAGAVPTVFDMTPAAEGTIFRRPLYNVPLADGVIVFGDPSAYGVLDSGGIVAQTEPLPATDNAKWYFRERTDGQVLLAEALILGNNLNG